MLYSMTGFGRYEALGENRKVSVEIKAVNHRYLDLNIKIPRRLTSYEAEIRDYLKENIARGKVDVFISFEDYSIGESTLHYNKDLAAKYMEYLSQMAEDFDIKNDIMVSQLSRYPEVITMENASGEDEVLENLLMEAVKGATVNFNRAREKEGESLKTDLIGKLDDMLGFVDKIEIRYPDVINEYRQKLHDKVNEILNDRTLDESRLATEIVLYADKICVDEETVRLRTHIKSMKDTLLKGGSIGRKLDFIAQEMNRESNTILSKSTDAEISDVAIELKTDVEKVREQIQNIE
ncbi:MAG: YicC family protein [Eubacterium sp.]|nr:YicC family protein [Eubacterium sp.]